MNIKVTEECKFEKNGFGEYVYPSLWYIPHQSIVKVPVSLVRTRVNNATPPSPHEYEKETILTAAEWLFPVTRSASRVSFSEKPISMRFCSAFMLGLKSRRADARNDSSNAATDCVTDCAFLILLSAETPEILDH